MDVFFILFGLKYSSALHRCQMIIVFLITGGACLLLIDKGSCFGGGLRKKSNWKKNQVLNPFSGFRLLQEHSKICRNLFPLLNSSNYIS